MTAAEAAAKDDGILIMVSNCGDGHGGEGFYEALKTAPVRQTSWQKS